MTKEDFLAFIRSAPPHDIVKECLERPFVHAIPVEADYADYIDLIKKDYPNATQIAIMGSGNWKFSLNPKNNLSEFHKGSDIDVSIVCKTSFNATWEELRQYHRRNYYLLSQAAQLELRRKGENIYSGFVTPKWLLGQTSTRLAYYMNTNRYSNTKVGYRTVNMMYFKDTDEVLDYYVRGFRQASRKANKYGI